MARVVNGGFVVAYPGVFVAASAPHPAIHVLRSHPLTETGRLR
jgi:hypothetical protein